MNNENKSKGFRGFVKGKGYYIVLLLCAAAVGTSGYFLLTSNRTPTAKEASETTVSTTQAQNAPSKPAAGAVATQPTEPTAPTQETRLKVRRPVDGSKLTNYSVDQLAYNVTTRDWRTHEGVDLQATSGQNVMAAADGKVYTVYEDKSLGMTVVLQHANGYTTHYSNLSAEVAVSVGQEVSAGTVLGTVGDTACVETAVEPHLHFEVYRNNVSVDPEEFFSMS